MRYILVLLGLFVTNVANAIDCQKLPDCKELGYSKESVKGCLDGGYVICPWDETYKKCVDFDCETLGFTESDKSSWCADLVKCEGNPQMTLCQKACIATNAPELKELAESGKCKIVTVRNDITIPEDILITVASGTTIDGQNHTLTVNAPNKMEANVFTLLNDSGLANLRVKWSAGNNTADNHLFGEPRELHHDQFASHPTIYMHNLDITVDHNNPKPAKNSNFGVFGGGYFYYDGKISVHAHAERSATLFRSEAAEHHFRNADVDLSMNCDDEKKECLLFSGNVYTFENSSLRAEARDLMFSPTDRRSTEMEWESEGSITLINTVATFDHTGTYRFEDEKITNRGMLFKGVGPKIDKDKDGRNNNTFDLYVMEGSEATLKTKNTYFTRNVSTPHRLKLMGTKEKPAKLIMENITQGLQASEFTAGNPTDTFILNGTAYHPLKESTHKFTELDSSTEDWEKVVQ